MKRIWIVTALAVAVFGGACGGSNETQEVSTANAPARDGEDDKAMAFTAADLDRFERGLRAEIDAVKTAQKRAASATTAQERGDAMRAQWESATVPAGTEASGLSDARYRDVRSAVNDVFTTLDFQGKIDGPLSIDLERADAETKSRVSRDPFADLAPEAAAALRAMMERLVPIWSEYKSLVAVAG